MYVIPCVSDIFKIGGSNTPPRHTASVTDGATGVATWHDPAFNNTWYSATDPLVSIQPSGICDHV